MARTRKELTSELIDIFVRALDAPATFSQAAAITGFSERTMRSWIALGESENCQEPLLLELTKKYAKVMSSGKRKQLVDAAMEMALSGDAKLMQVMLKAFIPNVEPPTNIKVDSTLELKSPTRNLSALTTDEALALEALENKLLLAAEND